MVERATVSFLPRGEPEVTRESTARDFVALAAWHLHALLRIHGSHDYSGPGMAATLERLYRVAGRRSRTSDRGWQTMTFVDADNAYRLEIWIEADPLVPVGGRRRMRLAERVAELAES